MAPLPIPGGIGRIRGRRATVLALPICDRPRESSLAGRSPRGPGTVPAEPTRHWCCAAGRFFEYASSRGARDSPEALFAFEISTIHTSMQFTRELSQLAAFFQDLGAEVSIVKSRVRSEPRGAGRVRSRSFPVELSSDRHGRERESRSTRSPPRAVREVPRHEPFSLARERTLGPLRLYSPRRG